ncbi:hypothetical protein ACFUPZ_00545, partial [Microbacterium oxydans]|uniref:hypothetical protein n=1 Tax=Microbacterium oxydans TaxID=82380 RepID=UPI0036299F12
MQIGPLMKPSPSRRGLALRGREQICRAPKSLRLDGVSQAAGGEKLLVAARRMAYDGFMVSPLDG